MNNKPLNDFKVNTKLLDKPLYYWKSVYNIFEKQKGEDENENGKQKQTKFFELRSKIKLLTGDDIVKDKDMFNPILTSVRMSNKGKPVIYSKVEIGKTSNLSNICICSCCLCNKLYI